MITGPIAVVAPSGAFRAERFSDGLDIAREAGLDLRPLPGLDAQHRYLAGSDAHRLAHLVEALTDPVYEAVWIARGGYGITRLLHAVPWEQLPPRPVIGFSDVTALHMALHQHGLPAIHGPVVHSLPITDEPSRAHLFDLLAGRPTQPLRGVTWTAGTAEGALLGGNLCMLATLCGTPWQPDLTGSILVLEEVGEAAYRIDRMLQQLVSAGVLDRVAGVALGQMVGCAVPEDADWTLDDVFHEHLDPLGVPVLADVPIGHGAANRAFPVGVRARLEDGALSWEQG